ncbi:DUF2269 domain-containing protein [uncultured Microbulbifer sp.]|uniref:DUF2269 family protein n=1 Tax=uncultured Microbulbifer sp. TaxID=348147 RepID=UPI00260CE0AA|nr:DUF2269 domain-containing protein [uncultured Microbulbifer sp.]
MEDYFLLKMVHILSAVIVTGTGAGIAFFMFMASRSSNIAALAVTTRHVVLADWLFTAPAVVVQFVSGVLLMDRLGYSFSSTWFHFVITLFLFIGVCWIPVVAIQYKLKALADASLDSGELNPGFTKWMRYWTGLGILAFGAILTIFWLMVFKPFPVI